MLSRLRSLWRAVRRRDAFEDDMDAEMRFHLAARAADLARRGAAPDDARRRARIEFGSIEKQKDLARESAGLKLLDDLTADVRLALRGIRRHALLSLVVVATLTFGIGISAGVFSMLSAAALRPQLSDSDGTFVRIHTSVTADAQRAGVFAPATLDQYLGLRDRLTTVRALAASRNVGASIEGGGTERVLFVTCNFFEVYGVPRAALGRLFDARDCDGADRSVVLAHDTWARRFDRDPAIVGRTVAIAGAPMTVAGVLGDGFAPDGAAAWLPYTLRAALSSRPAARPGNDGLDRWLTISGRLAPGATRAGVQAEAAVVAATLDAAHPGRHTVVRVSDGALVHDPAVRGNVLGMLTLVMGALTVLVLIVCANITTLLLSQAAARRQEVAIRLAMGAGRARLVRMLVTETLTLATAAGVASYFVARAVPVVLLHWITERPPWFPIAPDWRVFAYLAAAVTLAGLAAAVAPAAESLRADLLPSLKGHRPAAGGTSRPRTHAVLVASQVALGFILLSGAALFVITHYQTSTREPGYESRHVLIPRVNFRGSAAGATAIPDPATVRDAIESLPGVRTVAFAETAPGFTARQTTIWRDGGPAVTVERHEVSSGFFSAIDLRIVRGRAAAASDGPCRPGTCAAVISEALARRLFGADPGLDALLRSADGLTIRIVGVAADTSTRSVGRPDPPAIYLPWSETGRPYQALVRFDGDTGTVAARVGAALRARFPGAIVDTHTLRWPLESWLAELGSIARLVVALGAAAAALATLGVFGVVSFAVSRREREFAIRTAVGASRRQIAFAVLRSESRPVAVGLALGAIGAVLTAAAFARVLAQLQFTISALDPRLYLAAAVPLTLAIAAGLLLPARRATRVDPLAALRAE